MKKPKNPLSLLRYCKKCGANCCKEGTPVVFPWEKEEIVDRTGKDPFKKVKNFYIIPDHPCPFLKDNLCSIEDIKPLNCKIFPASVFRGDKTIVSCPVKKLPPEFLENVKRIKKQLELAKEQWESYIKSTKKYI